MISKLLTAFSKFLEPTAVSPIAVAVMMIPHNNLCFFEGFSLPLSENILTTKMAESTELMMAIKTNNAVINIVNSLNGKKRRKLNSEVKMESNC